MRQLGDLRDEEPQHPKRHDDRENGLGIRALKLGQLDGVDPGLGLDLVASRVEQALLFAQCCLRRAREGGDLHARGGVGDTALAKHRHGRGDRPLRTDIDRRRQDELGDVLVEQIVGGGHLREPEVDDHRLALCGDEHVRATQIAVRDARFAHDPHLFPHAVQEVVGDVLGGQGVDGLSRHQLVHQDHRAVFQFGAGFQARSAHPRPFGPHRGHGLVLHGPSQ